MTLRQPCWALGMILKSSRNITNVLTIEIDHVTT